MPILLVLALALAASRPPPPAPIPPVRYFTNPAMLGTGNGPQTAAGGGGGGCNGTLDLSTGCAIAVAVIF